MQADVQAQGPGELFFVLLIARRLHAAEGGRRSAEPCVAQAGIVVVELSPARAARQASGQAVVQELLVRHLAHAEMAEEAVIEAPADVVVAAQVVEEGVFLRKGKDLAQLVLQQAHILGRHGVPGACHGGDIIEHVAFGLLHRAEIRDDLGGLHDHLAQQQCARADDIRRHVHHPHQGMDLREIAAVCAELLPDIGHRVQADDVHALIAEIEHVLRHVIEDNGIGVVQVPLIGVEGCHYDLVSFFAPAEVAGGRGRKHLRHRLFKLLRNGPVVIEEIPRLALRVSGSGLFCPLVILAGVVHHKIQAEGDAPVVAVRGQCFQIFHGPKLRLDLPEVCHRVTAVAAPLRALQNRHQMQIVHAAVFKIIQSFTNAVQAAGKGVHIH